MSFEHATYERPMRDVAWRSGPNRSAAVETSLAPKLHLLYDFLFVLVRVVSWIVCMFGKSTIHEFIRLARPSVGFEGAIGA